MAQAWHRGGTGVARHVRLLERLALVVLLVLLLADDLRGACGGLQCGGSKASRELGSAARAQHGRPVRVLRARAGSASGCDWSGRHAGDAPTFWYSKYSFLSALNSFWILRMASRCSLIDLRSSSRSLKSLGRSGFFASSRPRTSSMTTRTLSSASLAMVSSAFFALRLRRGRCGAVWGGGAAREAAGRRVSRGGGVKGRAGWRISRTARGVRNAVRL